MPSSGPVLPYQPTEGTGVSEQQYLQLSSEPPGANWDPVQIVEGFLAANASFAEDHKVAREYLTPQASGDWARDWSADVFKDIKLLPGPKSARTAVVTVSGSLQASVAALGTYAVPATNSSSGTRQAVTINLTKTQAGWRVSQMSDPVSHMPVSDLLLSATDFQANYQQRDLYFFDPRRNYLVADPVYVPVAAVRAADPEGLLGGLVEDLIKPPNDWLGTATKTTFPDGTKLHDVNLAGGIATVSLEGTKIGHADSTADQQMAAQLVWTLVGSTDSQPVVTGVQLSINGKFTTPPTARANPILQKAAFEGYAPPTGEQRTFYYLDNNGNVMRRAGPNKPAQQILKASAKGPHLSTIAVSPDGKHLAGLSNGAIYTGPVGGSLVPRRDAVNGFTSVSWDLSNNLWAIGPGGVWVIPAAPGAPAVAVSVPGDNTITALRVAPDGVRVALVVGGTAIQFAAINWESPTEVQVAPGALFSPFSVSASGISDVTWYGPDNVIALSGSGPGAQAIEYPVNGGNSTPVLSQPEMTNITASWNSPLIASTSNSQLLYTESIGGGWVPLTIRGTSVVYPG
jgi:hypothetical protein